MLSIQSYEIGHKMCSKNFLKSFDKIQIVCPKSKGILRQGRQTRQFVLNSAAMTTVKISVALFVFKQIG